MFKNGLGGSSDFGQRHPIVNLIFFTFAIGITMFSNGPVFLAVTTLTSWIYSILLRGKSAIKFNLMFAIPMVIIMAGINVLFIHNGATVLFYLNGNRITLEALIFGFAAAFLLTAVIIWFSCFNEIMSSDKFIYIFGKTAPVLGLTMSMIFRFIPLLKSRFAEISMGQKCMGRHTEKGFMAKLRQLVKEISILVSWSLEASIETADSMEARGYGLKGRTSFHLFKMTAKDRRTLVIILILGTVSTIGCALGKTSIYYYPRVSPGQFDTITLITLCSYIALLILPIIMDIIGEKKWQQLISQT